MKSIVLLALLFLTQTVFPQAGNNAVLELESTDKGLLLPRLNDTSSVSNPSSGLMIYNNNTQSPAFHNGTNWNTLAAALPMPPVGSGDSLTYTLNGMGSYFINGTYPLSSFNTGGNTAYVPGGPAPTTSSWSSLSLSKERDGNSIPFLQNLADNTLKAEIEIKIYETGASTPYYSIKVQNFYVTGVSMGTSANGAGLIESIFINGNIIGFKDWVNNLSFSYNIVTEVLGTY